MARLPRRFTVAPGHCVHKVWRGHNRENNIGSTEDKVRYLSYLNDDLESKRFCTGAKLQALTLMSNHVHEIFQVQHPDAFSNHMRRHHARYGADFNRRRGRSGKVAEGRPHTTLIADESHAMVAVFYAHANPIKAGIVKDARNYPWSTHQLYAFGKKLTWMRNIRLPDWYLRLGANRTQRQRKYRQLFAAYLKQRALVSSPWKVCQRFFGPLLWQAEQEESVRQWRRAKPPP